MKPSEKIVTDRLTLRMPVLDDASSIFLQYMQDEQVTKYLVWRPHQSIEQTNGFLQRCAMAWQEGSRFPWLMIENETGEIVGMIELRVQENQSDLGYVLAREHWGKGYATEAVSSVVNWVNAQSGITRLWATCDVDNPASARVLEKAGLERKGVLKKYVVHPNLSDQPRDAYLYEKRKELQGDE